MPIMYELVSHILKKLDNIKLAPAQPISCVMDFLVSDDLQFGFKLR